MYNFLNSTCTVFVIWHTPTTLSPVVVTGVDHTHLLPLPYLSRTYISPSPQNHPQQLYRKSLVTCYLVTCGVNVTGRVQQPTSRPAKININEIRPFFCTLASPSPVSTYSKALSTILRSPRFIAGRYIICDLYFSDFDYGLVSSVSQAIQHNSVSFCACAIR